MRRSVISVRGCESYGRSSTRVLSRSQASRHCHGGRPPWRIVLFGDRDRPPGSEHPFHGVPIKPPLQPFRLSVLRGTNSEVRVRRKPFTTISSRATTSIIITTIPLFHPLAPKKKKKRRVHHEHLQGQRSFEPIHKGSCLEA